MRSRRIKNKKINTRINHRKKDKSRKAKIIKVKQTNKIKEPKESNIKPFVKLNCSPKGKNEVKEYTC